MQVIYKNALDAIDLIREEVTEERTFKSMSASFNCSVQNAYLEIYRALKLVRDLLLQANENKEREGTEKHIFSFVSDNGKICEGVR